MKPRSDDPKADDPALYVVFGLLSLVLIAVAVGALVLPPMFVYSLLTRHHTVGAVALAAAWVAYIVLVGRKLMSARPPDDPES
jgi:RsiW-degrading membrane proteinase PrsW (M82 family)